ncbi:type III pantothenate kinase [Candidatus Pelagibacter sp.]|uniref:type III pantothenate kinase n=1 Tax=Candidatus Pelagibacter sp. TaxID=2024849 RepID=UPI003F83AFB4
MYLIGDIGNSEIKIFLLNNNKKVIQKISFPNNKISLKKISYNFKKINKYFLKIEKILFCSVVPSTFKLVKNFLNKKTKIKCYEIKELKLSTLIDIKVNYKQVGSDRLANAISLINDNKNYIIIDLGTATTFDILINKSYKGGIIAPGIKLSLNTLSDRASLIPKINLINIKKVIGVDTVSAVRSGFFWGYAGLIDNIINLIKKEIRKPFDIIITGGFAELIKSPIKTKVKIDKNITIKGLIKTLEIL